MNALSVGLLAELQQAVESLAVDLPGAVVITGTDRIFSAGADITEFAITGFGGTEQAAEVARHFASVLDAIAALPRATLAVISGGAFGGGLELALACDFRFVASGARLGQPENPARHHPWRRGYPAAGPPRRAGASKDIVLTGRHLSAEEALGIGLVDRVVAADTLRHRGNGVCLPAGGRRSGGARVGQARYR